jgi:hypothetical protein
MDLAVVQDQEAAERTWAGLLRVNEDSPDAWSVFTHADASQKIFRNSVIISLQVNSVCLLLLHDQGILHLAYTLLGGKSTQYDLG